MRRFVTEGFVAALLALPLTAGAAESSQPPAFDQADANGDGVVSVDEAKQVGVPEGEAKREDIDGDDQLTAADWKFVDMVPAATQGSAESGEGSQQ